MFPKAINHTHPNLTKTIVEKIFITLRSEFTRRGQLSYLKALKIHWPRKNYFFQNALAIFIYFGAE